MMSDIEPLKLASAALSSSDGLAPLFENIARVIQQARQQVQQAVNSAMVQCYWQIGCLIVEHEQRGQARAAYGKQQLQILSAQLTEEFGKGFDPRNLRNMRSFFLAYPNWNAVRTELSWTHYRPPFLLIESKLKRELEWERIKVQSQLLTKTDEADDD